VKATVWKWRSNLDSYVNKEGVVGVRVSMAFPKDDSLVGRDGWVGFEEELKDAKDS